MPGIVPNNSGDDPLIDEAAAWLARLRDAPTLDDQQAFETWYAADPAHTDAYDIVLHGWEASGKMAAAAQFPAQRPRAGAQSRSGYALATAAALLLVVLTGFGLNRLGLFQRATAPSAELASSVGEIRTLTLSDGSRVTLDTDSRLQIAFTTTERTMRLARGRARFDVAHDADRPFIVLAGGGSITAHGTVFDVAIADARVTVALLRGSVEVRQKSAPTGANNPVARRMLAPGQAVTMMQTEPLAPPQPLRLSEARWVSGMLSFEDARLAEIVAAANRYTTTQINLTDAASRDLRFTGTFKATDAAGLAKMLAATFALRLSQDAKGNFLLAASASSPAP